VDDCKDRLNSFLEHTGGVTISISSLFPYKVGVYAFNGMLDHFWDIREV